MVCLNREKQVQNLQRIYDFFERHPGVGLSELVFALGVVESTLRYRLSIMTQLGYLKRVDRAHYSNIGDKILYKVGSAGRPVAIPPAPRARRVRNKVSKDSSFNRKIAPAKQIGMHRDAFDALFFGPVRAEVQA